MSFDREQQNDHDDQNDNPSPANPARDPNQPSIIRPNPPQDPNETWQASPDYGDEQGNQPQN